MVTAPNDDWTEEMCIRLIQEYRKRPILWDPKDQFFFKKTMKPEAWEGIGAALGMPPEACKHKMAILQSSFRREKSKIMQSIKVSADDTKYTSTWFAFEEMAFLINKDTERKRQSTGVDDDCEDGATAIKRSLLEHFNEMQKQSANPKKKSTNSKIGTVLPNVSPKPVFNRVKVADNAKLESAPSKENVITVTATNTAPTTVPPLVPIPTIEKQPTEETLEEIKSFTNFIAFKMKKYSETTKNCVQQAICDIIFKADQNFYETVHLGSFNNYETTDVVIAEDVSDLTEGTIDLGNGQTIKLQMHDSD